MVSVERKIKDQPSTQTVETYPSLSPVLFAQALHPLEQRTVINLEFKRIDEGVTDMPSVRVREVAVVAEVRAHELAKRHPDRAVDAVGHEIHASLVGV